MVYSIDQIRQITGGKFLLYPSDDHIQHLLFDSRKFNDNPHTLFFALNAERRNGHQFVRELYEKGVRNFVVGEKMDVTPMPDANVIQVQDTLKALQGLAAYHRSQFTIPVIGITGSNGKTIVKEWIFQVLHNSRQIVRSPKSYNSQIGVPVSVWQINEHHDLGIFEAGISLPGEMKTLEAIIRPTIGLLTTIGSAHNEGFSSEKEKLIEKLQLFKNCQTIICCRDVFEKYGIDKNDFLSDSVQEFSWSMKDPAAIVFIKEIKTGLLETEIRFKHQGKEKMISIPFTDEASIENAISCLCVLIHLETDWNQISTGLRSLEPVKMRLELKKGINHCSIINDSYSADLSSLNIALNFLQQQATGARTVILSDLLQSGINEEELYDRIASLLKDHGVTRLIGIGSKISHNLAIRLEKTEIRQEYYLRTASFTEHFRSSAFKDETILIKGARQFGFEEIDRLLELKAHQTLLEINLNAIGHNLREYQKLLKPETKVMAMVKAFAYGSGAAEIAGKLQFHKVDYLAVAYADEGVELRKAGIRLPVMVMNPEEATLDILTEYNLEPEIYSFSQLEKFVIHLRNLGLQNYPVHIEIETGMNRLGLPVNDIPQLAEILVDLKEIRVQTVFTHLVASEDPSSDPFTQTQFELFEQASSALQKKLGYPVLRHISNSASIIRHPQLELDMVRLGIGLYGIDNTASSRVNLEPVATLKTTVAQLKHLKQGDTVSYQRKGVIEKEAVIATLRIGYADGFPRRLGNGVGKVWIRGRQVPVIGSVCMDMIMADVTEVPDVQEGDDVVIFGKELSIEQVAGWADTIPYEIMTGISQRVKRVYYEE